MRATSIRLAIALAALGGFPMNAAAHITVTASTPAAGNTVRTMVREVRITFSQRVALQYTRLTIVGPGGVEIPLASLLPADSAHREFVATLAEPLPSGGYTVRWRTAGADGHVLSGQYGFVVDAPDALDTTSVPAIDPSQSGTVTLQEVERDANGSPVAVIVRWTSFIAVVLALGVVAFRAVILPGVRFSSAPPEYWAALNQGLHRLGVVTGVLILLAAVPRLMLQSSALLGTQFMFDTQAIGLMLRDTNWGIGWLLQIAGGLGLLLAALLRTRLLAVVAALALALSPALSGHAMSVDGLTTLSVASDAMHVLAASTWLGSLVLVVLLALPLAMRAGGVAHAGLAAVVNAFSPIALTAAVVILLTGSTAALLHTTSLSQLWTTGYGRALLIKLGFVLLLAIFGYHNWKRVRPVLGKPESTYQLRRSAALELIVGALVLLVTAVLVALPTPP